MNTKTISTNLEDFADFSKFNAMYVDKTLFIEELLGRNQNRWTLITRPGRFGKTLMLSMLKRFLEIGTDNRSLFEGLAISKNPALCEKFMNQYPVLSISLKAFEERDFPTALARFSEHIKSIAADVAYLAESDKVSLRHYQKKFKQLLSSDRDIDEFDLQYAIRLLMDMLMKHWQKPVFLLVDDLPTAMTERNGYSRDMLLFVERLLRLALEDNSSLKYAVFMGHQGTANDRIRTEFDMFCLYGLYDFRYSTKFGFTQDEVDELLRETGQLSQRDVFTDQFIGYRFRDTDMYCPPDVLNCLNALKSYPNAEPKASELEQPH